MIIINKELYDETKTYTAGELAGDWWWVEVGLGAVPVNGRSVYEVIEAVETGAGTLYAKRVDENLHTIQRSVKPDKEFNLVPIASRLFNSLACGLHVDTVICYEQPGWYTKNNSIYLRISLMLAKSLKEDAVYLESVEEAIKFAAGTGERIWVRSAAIGEFIPTLSPVLAEVGDELHNYDDNGDKWIITHKENVPVEFFVDGEVVFTIVNATNQVSQQLTEWQLIQKITEEDVLIVSSLHWRLYVTKQEEETIKHALFLYASGLQDQAIELVQGLFPMITSIGARSYLHGQLRITHDDQKGTWVCIPVSMGNMTLSTQSAALQNKRFS